MPHPNDLSRSLVALEQDATLIAVIEMGQASWLIAGIVPGLERQPLKKLAADPDALLHLLPLDGRRFVIRWRLFRWRLTFWLDVLVTDFDQASLGATSTFGAP